MKTILGIILKKNKVLSTDGMLDLHIKGGFLYVVEFDYDGKVAKNSNYIDDNMFLSKDIQKMTLVSNWSNLLITMSYDIFDGKVYEIFTKYLDKLKNSNQDIQYIDACFLYEIAKYVGILQDLDYKNMTVENIQKTLKQILTDYTNTQVK